MMIQILMILILLISLIMMILSSTLSKKTSKDREKNSPFECGFDPKTKARLPFSLQFFMIAVMFLIFDVEITIIMPLIMLKKKTNVSSILMISITLIIILILGLYHEWKQGALEWKI
uniref:NADH-ubiquinone oxidoreductase chain 3 n=1 Tax=Trinodes hirtus TaxID=442100 RepID=S4SUK7_9COLE|nr:NADH dehydrogenase subunit 3 [Trinodes hirtus]